MDTAELWQTMRTLGAGLDQAVTVVDKAGRVLEWNAAAERMYAIARTEIIGHDITCFFSPASLMVRRVLISGAPVRSTYHQPRPGIHVLVTALPVISDGHLVGAVAIERDVTRNVQLSAELDVVRSQMAALEEKVQPRTAPPAAEGDPFAPIRGSHPAIRKAVDLARRIAPTDVTVLIQGPSGAGKELFARGIHAASRRKGGPFVALNCGAIPPALFESELFGYAPGAFTGANPRGQPGKLCLAEGGTLLLDEIGELPLEAQVKLLRFLEDRHFYRVGSGTSIHVDIRIVAATNQPLDVMVQRGTFREDLFWRLNIVGLVIPPLRDRPEDIPELVRSYIQEFALRHVRPICSLTPDAMDALLRHAWPGNIRELRNLMERMVLLAEDSLIGPDLLSSLLAPGAATAPVRTVEPPADDSSLQTAVERAERDRILAVLAATGGRRNLTADLLGVSRATLYNKCRRLGIKP
jgi:sigma-54 dependent transcriptional regulator, acetoin dehydrogenase operon transcriptional activator AcoR